MPSWSKWGVSILAAVALVSLGWRFTVWLVTLHIMVCFLLVIVVMLQSGTAADLAGAFGGAGSQTAFGPRGAATFLSRATTWCAIVFMMTSMALSVRRAGSHAAAIGSILEETAAPLQSSPSTPTTSNKPAHPGSKPAPAPAPASSPHPTGNSPAHK